MVFRSYGQAFARGILANWLVCIAVWQCNAAKSLASKAVGIWFPISAFVALGLEHSGLRLTDLLCLNPFHPLKCPLQAVSALAAVTTCPKQVISFLNDGVRGRHLALV